MGPAVLVVAAVNAVWQSALVALAVGIALRVVRNPSARACSAIWTTAFFICALLLPLDLAAAVGGAVPSAPVVAVVHASHAAGKTVLAAQATTSPTPSAGVFGVLAMPLSSWATHFGFRLVAAWVVVGGFLLVRLALAIGALQDLKRRAVPVADSPFAPALRSMVGAVRGAQIAVSERISVPSAVGFSRPMVLLPRCLVERLEAEDLYASVAHEIAHLRRWDDVAQIAQQICLAALFFNPIMHLVARRVDFFREAACDDASVTSRASALRYAECLATILAHVPAARRSMAPALMHRGRQVVARVERLIEWKEESHTMGRAVLLIALGICTAALFFVRVELPLLTPHDRDQNSHSDVVVVSDNHNNETDDSLIGALSAAGYRPSVDDVIALSNAGVDSDTVVEIRRSGMERPSISQIVELADAGVDNDLISQAVRVFGPSIAVEDLIRLQNHGVDPDDFAALRSIACQNAPVSDVIALHDAGVDADYIHHLGEKGLQHLSVRDVIRLHDAGVDV